MKSFAQEVELEMAGKAVFEVMDHDGPIGSERPDWVTCAKTPKQEAARRYASAALDAIKSTTPAPQAATLLSYTEQAALRLLVDLAWNAVSAIDFSIKKKSGRLVEQEFIDEIEQTLLRLECFPDPPEPAVTVERIEYALRRILPDEDFSFHPELLEDLATPSPQADVDVNTAAAIALGAAVLTRIEDPAAREIATRNALTAAALTATEVLTASIRRAGLKARDELLERMADGGSVDNDLADYMARIVDACVRAATEGSADA